MEVSSVSNDSVLDIYAKEVRTEVEQRQKLAMIEMEQKMEQEKMDMAVQALKTFYA